MRQLDFLKEFHVELGYDAREDGIRFANHSKA